MPLLTETQRTNAEQHYIRKRQERANEAKKEIVRQALDFVNMTHFGMPPSGRRGVSTFPIIHGSNNAFFEARGELLRQIDDATDHIGALRARLRNHNRTEPDDPNSDEWGAWALNLSAIEEEEAEWVQWCRSLYEELNALDNYFSQAQAELYAARRIDL